MNKLRMLLDRWIFCLLQIAVFIFFGCVYASFIGLNILAEFSRRFFSRTPPKNKTAGTSTPGRS